MKRQKYGRYRLLIAGFFFLFFIWMCSSIPYTHDDWDWGIELGMQQFLRGSVNSRYAGNLVEIIMTRSVLLKNLIMAAVFTLLPMLCLTAAVPDASDEDTVYLLLFAFLLFFMLPRPIWAQTSGWVAGFANYNVSALLLMVFFTRAFPLCAGPAKETTRQCLVSFILCFVLQLFIENLAVYMVLITFGMNMVYYKRNRRISKQIAAMLLGAVFGLAVAFSSNLFVKLFRTGAVTEVSSGLTGEVSQVDRAFVIIPEAGFVSIALTLFFRYGNFLITSLIDKTLPYNFIIVGLLALLLFSDRELSGKKRTFCTLGTGYCLVFLLSTALKIKDALTALTGGYELAAAYASVFGTLYYVCMTVLLAVLLRNDGGILRQKALFFWLSEFVVLLPLIIVMADGPRLAYTPAVFMIALILLLCRKLTERFDLRLRRIIRVLICLCLAAECVFFACIYSQIGQTDRQRKAAIEQCRRSGDKHLVLMCYPHSDYMWQGEPNLPLREQYFKEFYAIPQDVELVFIPYE